MTTASGNGHRMAAATRIFLIVTAASLIGACASGDGSGSTVPRLSRADVLGSWKRVSGLPPGSPLVVTLKSGDRLEGAFKAMHPSVLALTDPAGREFSVPRSDVRSVIARAARDDLTNGVLIGAGIGLGAALAVLGIAGSRDGYVLPSAKWGAPMLLTSVGAAVGALIDRAHNGARLIYLAPSSNSRAQ